jgi:hypothetical protein
VVFVAGALPPHPRKELLFLDLLAFPFSKKGQKERDHAKYESPTFFSRFAL